MSKIDYGRQTTDMTLLLERGKPGEAYHYFLMEKDRRRLVICHDWVSDRLLMKTAPPYIKLRVSLMAHMESRPYRIWGYPNEGLRWASVLTYGSVFAAFDAMLRDFFPTDDRSTPIIIWVSVEECPVDEYKAAGYGWQID